MSRVTVCEWKLDGTPVKGSEVEILYEERQVMEATKMGLYAAFDTMRRTIKGELVDPRSIEIEERISRGHRENAVRLELEEDQIIAAIGWTDFGTGALRVHPGMQGMLDRYIERHARG